MNYFQILKDSLHILRTTKLVWVFGFICGFVEVLYPLDQLVRRNPGLLCIDMVLTVVYILISLVAEGGLIYLIHQKILNNPVTFKEAWLQGRSKLGRIIGLFLLILPVILVGLWIFWSIATRIPTSPFLWLLILIIETIVVSVSTFGLCAIMIDDVKVFAAAWTGFLITLNNFFSVFIINAGLFFVRNSIIGLVLVVLASGLFKFELSGPLSFAYPTYAKMLAMPVVSVALWAINLFLVPLTSAALTFCYIKFTNQIHYPALSKKYKATLTEGL